MQGLDHSGLDPNEWFPLLKGLQPYPGFVAFEERDAGVFFGRDRDITRYLDELNQLQQIEQAWEQHFQQQGQEQVDASTEIARTTSWREANIRVTRYDCEVEAEAKEKIKLGPDVIVEKPRGKKVDCQYKPWQKNKGDEADFSVVVMGAGQLMVGQTEVDPKGGACRHRRLQEKRSQQASYLA